MSLTELQEKRGRLVTQAREALDEIKANTDEARSAELEERHDAIMADFDKVERDISREQRQADLEARAAELEAEARANKRPGQRNREQEAENRDEGGNEAEYRRCSTSSSLAAPTLANLSPKSAQSCVAVFSRRPNSAHRPPRRPLVVIPSQPNWPTRSSFR